MASAQRILTIDLGSSNLKAAAFQVSASGDLTLLRYGIKDMGLDPNKEQDRFPFILETLQNLLREKGLPSAPAYCSLSGQFAFTRFVKLPPVAAAEIDKMVVFEAQQNVPFPINEVVWDYQMLGGTGAKENEALIVAIKQDIVEQAAGAFRACKIELAGVDVAGLALINAFYYNYGVPDECHLLIDIGAKNTNLIFIEGSRIFIRVIPVGGHLISQNISNEFQEPYVAAETLKKGKGFVGLGGAYKDPDDAAAARISKIARSIFSKLHAELNRSVGFYRNQQGGSAPKKIHLAGGSACMPFADLFFKEKMNIPVEHFNPLRNVNLAQDIDRNRVAAEAFQLGELVGLALRMAGECPVEINLEPSSAKVAREKRRAVPYLVVGLLAWAACFAAIAGVNFLRASAVSAETAQLQSDYDQKTTLAARIEKADKELASFKQRVDAVQRLVVQRDYWPDLLVQIGQCAQTSTGLWLTQMDMTFNNQPLEAATKGGSGSPGGTAPSRPRVPAPGTKPLAPGAKPTAPETSINVAPRGTEINLRGFVEASQWDILNTFVSSLQATGWFEKIDIINREPPDGDQVATLFLIKATLKEDRQVSLQP
ncbi:MAG: pilus assembly protein PilM [Candidatus Methylacidiphilales bacterium]|nr:pilus assembly protein PilM [Candidatus Methylacidiphilales bacterium]